MKKSPKGEVVLSPCQIQAARLNQVERHRFERNVDLLREDLDEELTRIHRQGQALKFHFTNVVQVVKPNRAYELWKQTHAHELAQQEANEFFGKHESMSRENLCRVSLTFSIIQTKTKIEKFSTKSFNIE